MYLSIVFFLGIFKGFLPNFVEILFVIYHYDVYLLLLLSREVRRFRADAQCCGFGMFIPDPNKIRDPGCGSA
jgi:hypothetical protein